MDELLRQFWCRESSNENGCGKMKTRLHKNYQGYC